MNRYVVVRTVYRVWKIIPIVTAGVRRNTDSVMVFVGEPRDCEAVARELNTAYRDGKFAAETGSDELRDEGLGGV